MNPFRLLLDGKPPSESESDGAPVLQFAAQEEKRQKNERLHQLQKHENQMRDLQLQCDANVRELQQLQVETPPLGWPPARVQKQVPHPSPCAFQNEKCHLLIEHETQKLKELDEEHGLELKEWREKLRPRKKVERLLLRIRCSPLNVNDVVGSEPESIDTHVVCVQSCLLRIMHLLH